MGPKSTQLRRLVFALLAVLIAVHAVHTVSGLGSDVLLDGWIYTAIEFAAVGVCVWRAVAVETERLVWTMISLYVALWAVSDLGWTIWLNGEAQVSFPNWTDAGYLASYIFAIAGLILLMRSRMRSAHIALLLDGLVAGLAMAAVAAALIWRPITDAAVGSDLAVATTLSYPILDLGLLCIVGLAFGVTGWRPGWTWSLLGASLVVNVIADGFFSYMEATGDGVPANWINTMWPVAIMLASASAWQPRQVERVQRLDLSQMVVPMGFAACALGVLLYGQVGLGQEVPFLAAVIAALALVAASVRGAFTFSENVALLRHSRKEALTDNLTGLGNRRALIAALDERLIDGFASQPATLVFFDLDGFKGYNDVFGHSAGDELLMRFGQRLRRSVVGRGVAYRPGGDEFCAIFDGALDPADDFVVSSLAALAESGEGFDVAASFGLVVMPREADTPTQALTLVDQRMYADKSDRRVSARLQARDLLLQLLHEREPVLDGHLGEVAILVEQVAKQLGLVDEQIAEISKAAELHDLGKVAIPGSILRKSTPLDEDEWRLMRQHTIVGERILAAVPNLRMVAQLVRSSHERWDGGGYPDGLVGEQIPLGSRIIAVCDAFDAMVSSRPYAKSMSREDAADELRRCGGTQFDPDVVAAFLATMESPERRRGPRRLAA